MYILLGQVLATGFIIDNAEPGTASRILGGVHAVDHALQHTIARHEEFAAVDHAADRKFAAVLQRNDQGGQFAILTKSQFPGDRHKGAMAVMLRPNQEGVHQHVFKAPNQVGIARTGMQNIPQEKRQKALQAFPYNLGGQFLIHLLPVKVLRRQTAADIRQHRMEKLPPVGRGNFIDAPPFQFQAIGSEIGKGAGPVALQTGNRGGQVAAKQPPPAGFPQGLGKRLIVQPAQQIFQTRPKGGMGQVPVINIVPEGCKGQALLGI